MKNEDLLDLSENLDESYIEEVGKLRMTSDISGYDAEIISITQNSKRGLSRVAVAVIAFASVLILSGGVIWAMTNTGLKDFFFGRSDDEFDEMYMNGGKEYNIGEHKLVYEGSIYDKGVEQICLNFSVWDAQGQPVDLDDDLESLVGTEKDTYELYPNYFTEAIFTNLNSFRLKDDVWGLLVDGASDIHTSTNSNSIFFTISRFSLDYSGNYRYKENPQYQDFKFTIINLDEINELNNSLKELSTGKNLPFVYDSDSERWAYEEVDYAGIHEDVARIIDKYDMIGVDSVVSTAQVIQVENLNLTIGRMCLIMEYDANDCIVEEFTIIREDGTKTKIRLDESFCDDAGNPTDTRVNWIIDGVQNRFGGGGYYIDKGIVLVQNFGYILGNNEKVKIEANGKIYE